MNIPKGYKLVPVEPTVAMEDAAAPECGGYCPRCDTDMQIKTGMQGDVYRAMLAAAPTPLQPIYDEAKERELFEVHYREKFEAETGRELSDSDIKSMRDGPLYGESRHYLNGQWVGWKACAQSRAKAGEV